MKKSLSLMLCIFCITALCIGTACAQNKVNGGITRVTENGVQLTDGVLYRWADDMSTTLEEGQAGTWTDLRVNDEVHLALDNQNRVRSVRVTGKRSHGRVVRSLLEMEAVQGHVESLKDVLISGRVFNVGTQLPPSNDIFQSMFVFVNRDSYDMFESWLGFRTGHTSDLFAQFEILGDGELIYTSPRLTNKTPGLFARVPIKGYGAITIQMKGKLPGYDFAALMGDPVFVKLPSSVPKIASPVDNARITRNTPFVWEGVDNATGYLLEMQSLKLANPADQNNANRYILLTLAADTTIYNFDVKTMPKGRWRWRVHALNDTGFLGEMAEWRVITSQ